MTAVPIALTPGDPSGIGPEIAVRFLADLPAGGARPVVFGDARVLARAADSLGLECELRPLARVEEAVHLAGKAIGLIEVPWSGETLPVLGQVSRESGAYAHAVLEAVAPHLAAGRLPAVVTGPISKEAIQLTRPTFIGHTEFFAQVGQADRFGMLLVVEPLRAIHVTAHVPFGEVVSCLTQARIEETIDLAAESLRLLGAPDGNIAVCGLNPHAGEAGRFGREELETIIPAVRAAQARGLKAVGPLPPDTVFYRALNGEFQVIVCMYHDQGHIPLKMHGFDRGVNVTVGLPFVRTSVDHGTAFELAGTGKASASSLRAAWELAERLVFERRKKL
ncbi:4-hydroxythreonine-4-phosphate dehydrogenase PdxA [bacterium]|nr:4-hydroxythreonine-4-phosphate dehydrogenase PdxA [bacterium]